MNRLLVAILAAFDAVLAAVVGLALALAPLTLLWLFGFGLDAPWDALWPSAGKIWQLGHLVPLQITLPREYTVPMGIDDAAASFVLSLAPLAFATFTALFAARSGARAASAGAWPTGAATGALVFTVLATGIGATTGTAIAQVELWQAVLFPALVFAVPLLCSALGSAWRGGDGGYVDALRRLLDRAGSAWSETPGHIVRGAAIVTVGLIGLGAVLVAVSVIARGGRIIALFQAGQADALGATVLTLGQLAYLPTLIVWAISFVAGPGFAVGEGTIVAPAGTQLGVVPGIPVLGALPETTTTWLLLLALLPVALGALAGRVVRAELIRDAAHDGADHEPIGARIVTALGIAALAAGVAAVLCVAASGSLGPGALSGVGPHAGPVALAIGVETLIGAAILLLAPHTGGADAGDGEDAGLGRDIRAGGDAELARDAAPVLVPFAAAVPRGTTAESSFAAPAVPAAPAAPASIPGDDEDTVEVPTSWLLSDASRGDEPGDPRADERERPRD